MISGNRLTRSLAFALVAASATLAASTSNAAAPRYDGLWSVSIVTEKGDCDRGYRYPVRINHGDAGQWRLRSIHHLGPRCPVRRHHRHRQSR